MTPLFTQFVHYLVKRCNTVNVITYVANAWKIEETTFDYAVENSSG